MEVPEPNTPAYFLMVRDRVKYKNDILRGEEYQSRRIVTKEFQARFATGKVKQKLLTEITHLKRVIDLIKTL